MQETPNYNLPLYEMDDMANLNDGYNGAMNIIDSELKSQADDFSNKFPLQSTDLDNGIITASKMATNAIDTVNIIDGAVTNAKLAADSVETGNLVDGAVTNAKLAADSVETGNLVDGAVTNAKLADNSVETGNLVDGAVTNAKLAADSVETGNIVDGAVTLDKISDFAFDSIPTSSSPNLVNSNSVYKFVKDEIDNIAIDGSVTTADLVDGSVTRPKIANNAFDSAPTQDSYNLLTSGAVYEAIEGFDVDVSKKMVVIGDSFISLDNSWGSFFEAALKKLYDCTNSYNFAVGGTGFASGSTTFATQLNNANNSPEFDNDDVDLVFVIGNVNDTYVSNQQSVLTAITSFNSNVKNVFKNATVHYCIGDIRHLESLEKIRMERDVIRHISTLGAFVHDMLGVVPPSLYTTNGEHWSANGCILAANYIYSGTSYPATWVADISVNSFGNVFNKQNNFGAGYLQTRGCVGKDKLNIMQVVSVDSNTTGPTVVGYFPNAFINMNANIGSFGLSVVGWTQNSVLKKFTINISTTGYMQIRCDDAVTTSDQFLYIPIYL